MNVTWLTLVLGLSLLVASTAQADSKKSSTNLVVARDVQSPGQTPQQYFANHPTDTRGQGNLGQPEMCDPYGFDKDSDREGQARGRPHGGCAPVIEPLPDPDPVSAPPEEPVVTDPSPTDPVPTPVADLPAASLTVSMSYQGGQPPGISRLMQWGYPVDAPVTAYRVYEQSPGEVGYHLLATIDATRGRDAYESYFLDFDGQLTNSIYGESVVDGSASRWLYVQHWPEWWSTPGERRINLQEWRVTTHWPVGTYRHFIVAVDALGHEGPKSAIQPSTIVTPIVMLQPHHGDIVEPRPVFSWTDVSHSIDGCLEYSGYLIEMVDMATADKWWRSVPASQTNLLYDGTELVPGHSYTVVGAFVASDDHWAINTCPEAVLGPTVGTTAGTLIVTAGNAAQ